MSNRDLRQILEPANMLFALAAVIAFSLVWNTARVIEKNYYLQQDVDQLKNEIAILELENDNLNYNIEYFRTDAYLDLAAREKFNKKAAGERVVFLPKLEAASKDEGVADEAEKKADKPQYQENLDQWLYFLFDRKPS